MSNTREPRPFLANRLTLLALVFFASTLFVPWVAEVESDYVSLYWSSIISNHEWRFLQDYWLTPFLRDYRPYYDFYRMVPNFYVGWLLVFACQISALVTYLTCFLKPKLSEKMPCVFCMIAFPIGALVFGSYQLAIQHEIFYETMHSDPAVFPYLGIWAALISIVLLLVSFIRSPEWLRLRGFGVRRLVVLSLLVCLVGFSAFSEVNIRTQATKLMIVGKPEEKLPDSESWESHFALIAGIAFVFQARIMRNSPDYCYCTLEVPVISFRKLSAVYQSIGYVAYEVQFPRLWT